MKARLHWAFLTLALVLLFGQQFAGSGQVFQVLHGFTNGADGGEPEGALNVGNDGNLYGTTSSGGQWGGGTVFKLTQDGTLTTMASFDGTNYGNSPIGAMVLANDGNFYGTSSGGARGNAFGGVFKMTPDGSLSSIFSFTGGNGSSPMGDLVQGSDGNIYGTTQEGGSGGWGTVFRLVASGTNWNMQTLATFPDDSSGIGPSGGAIQATNGKFYGVTYDGGNAWSNNTSYATGTVYQMTTNGTLTTLATLWQGYEHATYPIGRLLQASDGNFYGAGSGTAGGIFKVTPQGELTTLVSFLGANGWCGTNPNGGLVQANDGNIYGTAYEGGTNNYGAVFRITLDGFLTPVFSFDGGNGSYPQAGLVQGSDGNLYGTTYGVYGNVFRIIMPGPLLTCAQAGGQLLLSWRTNYVGYTLQSSPSLASGNWSACTNPPAVVGGQFVVTNPVSGGAGFFRLKR
jgi:uncharacterized repeat protein (TIGR03803 family)